MDEVIRELLRSAELYYRTGMLRMADAVITEIERRLGDATLDGHMEERFSKLCELVPEFNLAETKEQPKPRGTIRCDHCDGIGKYRNIEVCYACRGKGFLTPTDVARNIRKAANREKQILLGREVPNGKRSKTA